MPVKNLCATFLAMLLILSSCSSEPTEQAAQPTAAPAIPAAARQSCPESALPWDINWLPADTVNAVIVIDRILDGTGLEGLGATSLNLSTQHGINPAFALAMFRKEATFAADGTRARRNNNPGNIIATGECRGLPANSACSGNYGEVSTDGRFAVFASMASGTEAYYLLLASEYAPGTKRDCQDIHCIREYRLRNIIFDQFFRFRPVKDTQIQYHPLDIVLT